MDKLSLHLPAPYAQNTPVLVAFSGGADSSLLLHLLKDAGVPLYAVHVHHGLRGADADADLAFCERTCRALHVPFFAVRIHAQALARKQGQSVETAAREARYRHFARLMKRHNIPLLATAHHADDNLETLLFRLCRGTGTRGLCGIPALAPLPGTDAQACKELHVFRPLLHLTKREILDACARLGIDYVTDQTNACNDYARNRIRNRVIPELMQIFPHPQHAASRLCRAASEDCDALDAVADQLYATHAKDGALPLCVLQAQPPALSKRLSLRLYAHFIGSFLGNEPMLEAVHLDAVLDRVHKGTPGSISLPGDVFAVLDRDALRMHHMQKAHPEQADACDAARSYCIPLPDGFFEIPGTDVAIFAHVTESLRENQKTVTEHATNVYNLYTELRLRFDTIKGRVFLRPLQQGDRLLHGNVHKKVRKLYGQYGVPLFLRPQLPLLCDDDGILAVAAAAHSLIRDNLTPQCGMRTLCVQIFIKR